MPVFGIITYYNEYIQTEFRNYEQNSNSYEPNRTG